MPNPSESVVHNPAKSRFEVVSGSQTSKLVYQMRDEDTIDLVHTEVPEDLAGQGIGSALVTEALTYARDNGLLAIPSCPFVASYVQRHPEWNEVVAEVR
jgi:predicted GNAT family acetyltransferase